MLEHLRTTAQLTQRELASLAGVTQETLSQLETGKSTRPRLETLTKLRDALELDDMAVEDLLDPCPLDADDELAPAASRLISLLKVLPRYDYRRPRRMDVFWAELNDHLGYQDDYPARKLSGHLELARTRVHRADVTDLAEYTLMFFDPDDVATLELLVEHGCIRPGVPVARRWCRDVTDAAWILHRAAMTSYPQQVGQLYMEANDGDDPARIAELCSSVYDAIRARAFVHAPAADQLQALQHDPAQMVVDSIATHGGTDVQELAVTLPRAWPGLARNAALAPETAEHLVERVLAELTGPHTAFAGSALLDLSDRPDLPRPLLERINSTIDTPDVVNNDETDGAVFSSILNIRGTLHKLDRVDEQTDHSAQARREQFHLVTKDSRPAWWRRFL